MRSPDVCITDVTKRSTAKCGTLVEYGVEPASTDRCALDEFISLAESIQNAVGTTSTNTPPESVVRCAEVDEVFVLVVVTY